MKFPAILRKNHIESGGLNCLTDCNGACCAAGTRIRILHSDMTVKEELVKQGLRLEPIDLWPDGSGAGRYEMQTDCPERNKGPKGKGCGRYNGRRLSACEIAPVGGEGCRLIRKSRGLD